MTNAPPRASQGKPSQSACPERLPSGYVATRLALPVTDAGLRRRSPHPLSCRDRGLQSQGVQLDAARIASGSGALLPVCVSIHTTTTLPSE